jgi:hypothetical protein
LEDLLGELTLVQLVKGVGTAPAFIDCLVNIVLELLVFGVENTYKLSADAV